MKLKLPRAKKRLEFICDEVCELASDDDVITDVGTDHGYLPIMLSEKIKSKLIATDISKSSLEKAIVLSKEHNTEVDCRVGDGLKIAPETTIASICGIGGTEIAKILSDVDYHGKAVLQPVPTDKDLRQFLLDNNYHIKKDYVIFNENKFYFIFVLDGKDCKNRYLQKDKFFGKTNLKNMSEDFILYLKSEVNRLKFLENFDITKMSEKSKEELKEKFKYYNLAKNILKKGK